MTRLAVFVAAFGLAAVTAFIRFQTEPTAENVVSSARLSKPGAFQTTERSLRRVLSRNPANREAVALLSGSMVGRDDEPGALAVLESVDQQASLPVPLRLAASDLLFHFGEAKKAERLWRQLREAQPGDLDIQQRLVAVYGIQLRRDEWRKAVWALVEGGRAGIRELCQIIILEHILWQGEGIVETLENFVRIDPTDQASRRSLVRHLVGVGRLDEAKSHLDALANEADAESAAAFMSFAVATGDLKIAEEFLKRQDPSAKEAIQQSSDWRRGYGELKLNRGLSTEALVDLEFSARKAPFHPAGRQKLSLVYRLLAKERESSLHARASSALARLDRHCHQMQNSNSWTPELVIAVARDAASIGMVQEASAWVKFALANKPDHAELARLQRKLLELSSTGGRSPPQQFLDPATVEGLL